MKLNIKQIGTTLIGSVLTGATLLGGALAADISDFQKMGPSDTVVVVGASAATADVVGAINIGAALAQHGATATSSVTSATKVEGGANLASAKSLFVNDKINEAGVTTLTKSELPTTLASKTFSDAVGTSYKYDQYIDLGQSTSQLTYGKPSGQNEPMGFINMTSGSSVTSTAYAFKMRANFNDAINLSSTNVQGQTLTLFGVDYTIGSSSTSVAASQKLILFGSGNSAIIAEGEEASLMVGSTEHKITIDVISDASNAYISVDGGASTKVTNKALYTINGVDVYVNDIIYVSKTGGISKMKVSIGSGRITLEHGQAVKTGTSDTSIDGTKVTFTGTAQMSSLTVAVGAKESSAAFLKEGGELVDPVFGTVKLSFSGYAPALDDASRDTITVTTTGNDRASVKLTDYNSNEKAIDFATDASTTDNNVINLKDGNGYVYHITEGETANQNDYILADANDASHLFQVGSISSFGSSGAKVTLKDVFTGVNYDFNLNAPTYGNGSKSIDGQDYYINVTDSDGPVNLYWVAGTDLQRPTVSDAATASTTSYTTVYPAIKAKNGEKVYLTNATTVTLTDEGVVKAILPTGILQILYNSSEPAKEATYTATHDTDTAEASAPTNSSTSITAGNILLGKQYYNVTQASGTATIKLATSAAGPAIATPAILIKEKKNDNSAYETVILQTTDDSTGISVEVAPTFSGFSGNGVSTATSTLTKYLDLWGTQVNYDTSGQGTLTVKVPETQVSGGVYFLTSSATAPTTTTVGSGTVIQPSLGSGISKLDTEVGADKTAKNLILVGGPAINTLVAELGTDGKSPSLTEWRTQLQGKGIIQSVSNAFQAGKTAIVVAGYEKEETGAAALKLATDSALKGTAKQIMGGVWSDFTYPLPVVETVPENTTEEATPSA